MRNNRIFKFKKLLAIVTLFLFPLNTFAKSDLIGLWLDEKNQPIVEFIQGFSPNTGKGILFEKGKIKDIRDSKIEGNKFKLYVYDGEIKGKSIIFNKKTLSKSKDSRKITKTIDLKKETNNFINELTSFYWEEPDEGKLYYFMKGFSNETGIYDKYKLPEKESEGLGSWSIAKDVFNLDRTLYLNAKITDSYMIFLDKRDNIRLLFKGNKTTKLITKDLKTLKEKFVLDLTSGSWLSRVRYRNIIYKYRPIFGDLSGVIFEYKEGILTASYVWEYSIKTGSLKQGRREYVNAQIQGNYLLLLNKKGDVLSYQRSSDEIKPNNFVSVKKLDISEKDTGDLIALLKNQWHKGNETYQFVFKNENEGFLHRFLTYPLIITGNKIKIKNWEEVDSISFYDQELVFGKNEKSLALDTKQVYLKHISDEESKKLQKEKIDKVKLTGKKTISLNLVTISGEKIKIPLPIESLQQINKISIETD